MTHTPAPWKALPSGSIRCAYTDKDGDDIIIGGVKNKFIQIGSAPFTTPCQKEQQANAKLMAAAPELLEALEEIVDFTFNIGNEDNPDCYDAHKKAMRAIAKAKGE